MAIDTQEASLYGIGKGSAQIWGQNRALQGLQQAYQQDQLRKQKEDAEMSEQLSKINYDAARNEDLPQILEKYNGIKNTFTQMRGTNNQMDRIKLQAKMDQQKADLSRSVNVSKQAAQQIHDLGKLRLEHPDDISDDFNTQFKTLNGTSTFDPKFTDQANTLSTTALAPKFDVQAYNKKLADRSIDNYQSPERHVKDGRINATVRDEGKRLNEDNILHNLMSDYGQDRKLQRYINTQYKGVPIDQAIKKYAADIYVGNKDAYDTVKQVNVRSVNDPEPDKFYEHYNYELAHPKAPTMIVGNPSQDLNVPIGDGKKDNVLMKGAIKMPTAALNFAGSPAYDLKTGRLTTKSLPSSNDYQIVVVANVPFIKEDAKGVKDEFKGTIAQPNYAKNNPDKVHDKAMIHVQYKNPTTGFVKDYLIPYDRMPQNLSKQNGALLATFIPADNKPTQATPSIKSTGKKVIKGF